jgi:hypothetical protein
MKLSKAILNTTLAAVALSLSSAALAQEVGDWVLSPWQGSDEYYPGVIESRSGSVVTVRFDDGSVETRQADSVRMFDWRAGSRVTCQWSDGRWYSARINSISSDGYNMQIRYVDDGVIENTTTGKCRTR